MGDSVKVQHIPFYFGKDDLIKYISDEGSTTPNIVLGGGIQNLITFYQMAKEGLSDQYFKDDVKKFGELKNFKPQDISQHIEITNGGGNDNPFSPYTVNFGVNTKKVQIDVSDIRGDYYKDTNVQNINNLFMGGKNTTRKGGRRRRKARGRKTPKRRVKKSKK